MLYLFAILLAIVHAGNIRVCKCEDGVETAMNIPDEFLPAFMAQYPDSCEGSCNSCDCAGGSKKTITREFEVRPSGMGYYVDPMVETDYGCILFDASKFTEDQWITEIDIDVNMTTVHHGVMYGIYPGTIFDTLPYQGGCQTYGPEYGPLYGQINYDSCVVGAGQQFGDGQVVPQCFELRALEPRPQLLYAFQRGNPDFTAPRGTGILVGPSTDFQWIVLQGHYHSMQHGGDHGGMAMKSGMAKKEGMMMEGIYDKSGVILKTTNKNPGMNLGMMAMANLPHLTPYAPPGVEEFVVHNDVMPSGCGYPTVNEFYFGAGGPLYNGVANLSYPCTPYGPVGLLGHMMSKSNFESEILPNGGIDIHLSGLHWHLRGSAAAYVLRGTGGYPIPEEYDHHSQEGHDMGSGEHDHTTDHGQMSGQGGAPFGKCSTKPADQNGDPSVSNLHCFKHPVHVGLGDGLRTIFKYNTTGNMHIITGGYSSNQEMALQYMAYTPAPAFNPTIYAINACRTCLGAFSNPVPKVLNYFNVPDTPNYEPGWPTCTDPFACGGTPFTLEDPVTGAQQFCYPNVFQSVVQQSGACATQCTGPICQSA